MPRLLFEICVHSVRDLFLFFDWEAHEPLLSTGLEESLIAWEGSEKICLLLDS